MKKLKSLLKKSPYLWVAVIVGVLVFGTLLISKLKSLFTGGSAGSLLAILKAKDASNAAAAAGAASSNPVINANAPKYGEPVDYSKCEGVVATVKESFGWNDDEDAIIDALNTLGNGSEVKYSSELYKTKYAASLKAKVTATLNRSEKDRLSTIVQTNWY